MPSENVVKIETPQEEHEATPLQVDYVMVDGTEVRYGIRPGNSEYPLLLFNGIGANLELTKPFVDALDGVEIIVFDMPGVGGSSLPALPRRFPGLAKLANKVLDALGYQRIDVAGVSWGGALAQQFAKQYPERCRRLVLAATSMGLMMVPGKPSVLFKMMTPRRYVSKSYLRQVAPFMYGGVARHEPHQVHKHASKTKQPSLRGYLYQLVAGLGWTSAHWLHRLPHRTLVIAGDDDPIVPLINAKAITALMNHARLHIVRGGGHLFLVLRANEVVPVIRKFLAEPD